jgi:hypothetical protein
MILVELHSITVTKAPRYTHWPGRGREGRGREEGGKRREEGRGREEGGKREGRGREEIRVEVCT